MNLNIHVHNKGGYHNQLPKTILAEVIMTTELPGEKMINDQKNAMMQWPEKCNDDHQPNKEENVS